MKPRIFLGSSGQQEKLLQALTPGLQSDGPDALVTRTSGIHLRADAGDPAVLNGNDAGERAALIERRLDEWRSMP